MAGRHPNASMGLNVEIPDPPQLSNRGVPSEFESVEAVGGAADLRRAELEEILQEGAWNEAFGEWLEYTDLSEAEFRVLRDLGLFQQFDIFWDPSEERLRFEAPTLPEDWDERVEATAVEPDGFGPRAESELSDLGQTVVEMLVDAYVDWGEAEAADYVWSEETFGHGTQE